MDKDKFKEIDGSSSVTITVGLLGDRSKVVIDIQSKGGDTPFNFRLKYGREEAAQIAHAVVQAASQCVTQGKNVRVSVPRGKVLQLPGL